MSVVPSLWVDYSRTDGGRSRRINFNPYVEFKLSSRFDAELSAFFYITRDGSCRKGHVLRRARPDAPRARAYDDRYRPHADSDVAADAGGFDFQQFRSNAVFRWEYRPGSTLFLVWSQGRQNSGSMRWRRRFETPRLTVLP